MQYALLFWTGLLTACDQPREGLAGDLLRHGAQRDLYFAGDRRQTTPIAEVYRRRFFDGKGGPDEYGALEQLPPIPPTFDAPIHADPDKSRRLLSLPVAAHE
ncbi:hypothetical protein [Stutzerimonas nitrititolerans]|uniref:hypothetical protein n=1 Tax=Stutzerimonas nitrititolerans TaxID=2482751 RepID=UPI0028A2B15E|nr:hypothetical protein [Stutzerimonas nitrititolerans]